MLMAAGISVFAGGKRVMVGGDEAMVGGDKAMKFNESEGGGKNCQRC